MDSNQLAQFRAVLECGSITRAAQKLYVTQPALSIAINKLESELGCRLLNRDGRTITATAEGRKLMGYAVVVTETLRQAEDYFDRLGKANTVKCFRIGGINYPIISKGCASISGTCFSSNLVNGEGDLRHLAETDEPDIILADERHLPSAPAGYTREELFSQHLLLVCQPGHLLADYPEIPISELQGYAVVGHANPYGFTSWIKEIQRLNRCNIREDINLNFTTWRSEGTSLPLPYLMNSFGISTVWEVVHKLRIIPVTGKYTQRTIMMWYRTDETDRLAPVLEKLRDNTQFVLLADEGYHDLIFRRQRRSTI